MACGYQSAPFPVPPGPSQRHSKKLSSFLAELVFDSQLGEASSRTGTKQMVEAQGGWGERGQDPLGRGDNSPSLAGLSAFMVGNGGGLEMLSWGFALQPCTACEDQECRVCGCPEELVLPQVLVYLLAQLSAEPFSCVPSPEGVKTAFLGHKRLAYP